MGLTPLYNPNSPAVFKMLQHQNTTNRQRSFKRRRSLTNFLCINVSIIFLLTQNIPTIQAVPMTNGYLRLQNKDSETQIWHQRFIRDVGDVAAAITANLQQQQREISKDSLPQSSSTEVFLEQPQGQCLLNGEYVPETTVYCKKQLGCRAIQKTGHCCPDYKCDCQKDGKTYLNGDKLVDPETPCTVCYCQGGEILCSSVTCFHRDDCTPKYVAGVCCPQYDNCPVATSESSVNKTLATTSTTTSKPEMSHQAENNPKITIKEITKPIEIRITDDNKGLSIHQMLKPSTTSTTTTTTTTTTTPPPATMTTLTTPASSTPTPVVFSAIKTQTLFTNENNNDQSKESFEQFSLDNNQQKNGIASSKINGGINNGDTLKLSASVAYPPTVGTVAGISSTYAPPLDVSAEVEDPVPALSVFSTQGLPEDPSKVNIKREYFITTEGVGGFYEGLGSGDFPSSELIFSPSSPSVQAYNSGLQQTSSELDPDTAGSDNIYHIILTTDGPRLSSTSENYLALKGVSTTEGPLFDDLSASPIIPIETNDNLDSSSKQKDLSTTEGPTKEDSYAKSSTESVIHQHLDEEDSAIPIESNPAYPSLPEDDFSLRDNNYQNNDSDDVGDEPRSIGGSHAGHAGGVAAFETFKSTKHLEDSNYDGGSGMLVEDLMIMPSSTEGSLDFMHHSTEHYEKLKTPMLQPMNSAEDLSGEIRISSNDFKMEQNEKGNNSKQVDSTSLESSSENINLSTEFGSGSGEIKTQTPEREREPTTSRPRKNSSNDDIDELHDASGNGPQDDPKLDVESIKLTESQDDSSSTNPDITAKNNVLSIKIQPAQEKQFFDDLQ